MTRFKKVVPLALGALSLLPLLVKPSHADMTARRASDFVDTVGVSTQFWVTAGGGQYGTNPVTILQKMKDLKMRYYRGYRQNSFRDYGMKGIAFIDTQTNYALDANGIAASLNRYNGYESELIAVEGPNEYDFSGRSTWAAELKSYMLSLKNAVRARPALNNAALLGPSMAGADNFSQLGNITDRADIANAHAYSGDKEPESPWYEDWNQGYMIDAWRSRANSSHPNQPMWVTETGYINVSDDVKAKYTPRHYLWYFMRGVQRTMTFEMVDGGNGHNWGLLRQDLSDKPAYTSLKNFMAVVNDSNSSFTPGTLGYSLTGDMTGIYQCLLQKGDGTYLLMVWQGTRGWNGNTGADTPAPNRNLTLNLTTAVGAVNTYLPKNGAGVVNTYNSPTSISLSVPDHVLMVELKPAAAQNGVPNGTYKIVNKNSGKALMASGSSTANGANIVQFTYSGMNSQRWTFTSLGGGYYSIKNVNSGQFMDIAGQSLADGGANIQWPWNGGNNQQWSLSPAGAGYYNIVNRNSGKVLDIAGASLADNAQDIQYFYNSGDNQRWAITAP